MFSSVIRALCDDLSTTFPADRQTDALIAMMSSATKGKKRKPEKKRKQEKKKETEKKKQGKIKETGEIKETGKKRNKEKKETGKYVPLLLRRWMECSAPYVG